MVVGHEMIIANLPFCAWLALYHLISKVRSWIVDLSPGNRTCYTDWMSFQCLLIRFVVNLQGILKQNKFTSEFLIKLVAINLFLLWNIRTGGADDLEEFDCIGRDEEVNRWLIHFLIYTPSNMWRHSGLMVSALVSGLSGPCLSPSQGHCV